MSENDSLNLVAGIVMMVLVGGSLLARRLSLNETVRFAAIWVAIFGVAIVLLSFREEGKAVWTRVSSELLGTDKQMVSGDTLILKRGDDGHYWVKAYVNGREAGFLVDSGATTTGMTLSDAEAAGVDVSGFGLTVAVNTANGIVEARRTSVDKLVVGSIVTTDFPIIVAEEFGDTNVLGMNFLSRLQSWKVEGDTMTLIP